MNLCPEFAPVYLPMVSEPQDWDADGNGGYLTLRQPLVKTRFEGHTEALESADLSAVRQSINIIQQTAWSVHTGLLSIAQAAFDERHGHRRAAIQLQRQPCQAHKRPR